MTATKKILLSKIANAEPENSLFLKSSSGTIGLSQCLSQTINRSERIQAPINNNKIIGLVHPHRRP